MCRCFTQLCWMKYPEDVPDFTVYASWIVLRTLDHPLFIYKEVKMKKGTFSYFTLNNENFFMFGYPPIHIYMYIYVQNIYIYTCKVFVYMDIYI